MIEGHLGFPALGIVGAASATVAGTVVSCIMSIISIMKMDNFVSLPYIFKNKLVGKPLEKFEEPMEEFIMAEVKTGINIIKKIKISVAF